MPRIRKVDGDGMSEQTDITPVDPDGQAGMDLRDRMDNGFILGESETTMDHAGSVTSQPSTPELPPRHGKLDTLG